MVGDSLTAAFTHDELLANCLASWVAGVSTTSAVFSWLSATTFSAVSSATVEFSRSAKMAYLFVDSCLVSVLGVTMVGIFECAFVPTDV